MFAQAAALAKQEWEKKNPGKDYNKHTLEQIKKGKILLVGSKDKEMAKNDIQPKSLFNKMNEKRDPPSLNSRNFPENEMQMNSHNAAQAAKAPNPTDPFK